MNTIELATLAGFFAGEGAIVISGGKWPTLYASVGNTEKLWIDLLYTNFGGARYIEKPKYAGAKYVFRWRVCGKKAKSFLEAIQPYLIGEKAEQLSLGLRFQDLKNETEKPNLGYSSNVCAQMDRFRESLKSLRRAAAETNRKDASPERNDSPILEATLA